MRRTRCASATISGTLGSIIDIQHDWSNVIFNSRYQPRQGVMLSSEWGTPNKIRKGFRPEDLEEGHYGNRVYVWNWEERRLLQTIELPGMEGIVPLEIRFMHDPTKVASPIVSLIYDNFNFRSTPSSAPTTPRSGTSSPVRSLQSIKPGSQPASHRSEWRAGHSGRRCTAVSPT